MAAGTHRGLVFISCQFIGAPFALSSPGQLNALLNVLSAPAGFSPVEQLHGIFSKEILLEYYPNKSLGGRGRHKSCQNALFGKIVEKKTSFRSLALWLVTWKF